MKTFFLAFLNGIGQIMLQPSAAAGALFLAGIWAASPLMALGGVVGALAGMLTAWLSGFSREDIGQGLYGFNGALVGIALLFNHVPDVPCYLLIVLGSALSSLLMRLMLRRADRLPPYTAPFVLSAWAMLALADWYGIEGAGLGSTATPHGDAFAVLRGLGQVMFQESWITGAWFAAGLLLHSRQAAAWALIGSTIGLVAARGLGYPQALADAGVFGFNAVLAGIALGAAFRDRAMLALAGIVLSVLLLRAFELAGLPALTAPFVLSTWFVIVLERRVTTTRRARLPAG